MEKLSKERVLKEARQEIEDEICKGFKSDLKGKFRELAAAKKVVGNIEREIEDLELKIDAELS